MHGSLPGSLPGSVAGSVAGSLADPHLTGLAILWLTLIVGFGAVVPVIPTGAAVSATAVLAEQGNPLALLLVLGCATAGAWGGDLVVYAACLRGGEALARRLRWFRGNLDRVGEELDEQGLSILLVSRLVPGGRVPVFLAAGAAHRDWRGFAAVDLAACALWALVYALIGLVGRSLFPEPWVGVVVAVVLVVAVSWALGRLHDHRERVHAQT